MVQIQRRSSRIARRAVNQGARPAMVPQVAVEKSATGTHTNTNTNTKHFPRLLKGKKTVFIATLNVQTLQKEGKIPELIASAEYTNQDIICWQEHRFIHEELTTKEHAYGNWRLITRAQPGKTV